MAAGSDKGRPCDCDTVVVVEDFGGPLSKSFCKLALPREDSRSIPALRVACVPSALVMAGDSCAGPVVDIFGKILI